MSRSRHLPKELLGRPFTTAEALEAGVTPSTLRGPRLRRVHRGVYIDSTLILTLDLIIAADLLALPPDAALSHTTALEWYGLSLRPSTPRHYSTNTRAQIRTDDVVLHRRKHHLHPTMVRGVPILRPDRTLIDCAAIVSPRELVQIGDWMVRRGLTTQQILTEFAMTRHLHGVVNSRQASLFVREKVDSIKETDVRLALVVAGLPEPEVNGIIDDEAGSRGDLVYRRWRVVVEYDGWHHERDAEQRQKDIWRRERLEAAGWVFIVVTTADLATPTTIVARVWEALLRAGYRGPEPQFSARQWHDLGALAIRRRAPRTRRVV